MKILLSDREGFFIPIILSLTNWEISLLITDDTNKNIPIYKNESRIKKLMTLTEVMSADGASHLDLEYTYQFMKDFYLCDYGFRRIRDDFQFSHYEFISSIGFWNDFFSENNIDMCIITNLYHGFPNDYILKEISLNKNVQCYHIFYPNGDKLALYDANKKHLLEIKRSQPTDNKANDLYESAHYTQSINYDEGMQGRKRISRIVYKLGGAYLYRMLKLLQSGKMDIHYRECTVTSYRHSCKEINKTLKYVQKLYKKMDENEKFVIYFLHFEPEAVVTNYGQYISSQLIIIEMLAKSLPDGWKLYVKEHPDIYKLGKMQFEYHYPVAHTFITDYFYNKIVSIPNVKLINYRISATELIHNSMAVSTMAGTVAAETILNNKPLILYQSEELIYSLAKDCLCAKSTQECREYLAKVANGFKPDYSDFIEARPKFLTNIDEQGRKQILMTIQERIKNAE